MGWWGLLMVPAIIIIHCLQRQRQPIVISTLFLIQHGAMERRGGRQFVFWRHSITFWLQILAALLITWLLLQPRWIGEHSVQRVAFVLDSSLSMEAFQERMMTDLQTSTKQLEGAAANTDWLLMESDPRGAIRYRGGDRDALLQAASTWQSTLGVHDWASAVGMARSLVGKEGVVVFVTDHVIKESPHQMAILAVGEHTDNVGFTGAQVTLGDEGMTWRTLLKNYSEQAVSQNWWIEIGEEHSELRTANIPANGSLALGGIFPKGIKQMTLVLEDDAWAVDNRLPLVLPEPKRVAYQVNVEPPDTAAVLRDMMKALGETYRGTLQGKTDILIAESPNLEHLNVTAPNQILFAPTTEDRTIPVGIISQEDHELNAGLNWNSLAVRGGIQDHTLTAEETALVWLGDRPLIWYRQHTGGADLVFNFSLTHTNLSKLPATVLLLGRFVETVREKKLAYEARNVELGESLVVVLPPDSDAVDVNGNRVEASTQLSLESPPRPDFTVVKRGEDTLLQAASHFADVREADLRAAESTSNVNEAVGELKTLNSVEDAYQDWWLLLLVGIMLGSWHFAGRGR